MKDESKERWLELCERASKEQDPKKMLALMSEINRLLEEKEARLHQSRPSVAATSGDSFFEFALPTTS
jgi:hypothetical protein